MTKEQILQPGEYTSVPKSLLSDPDMTPADKIVFAVLVDHLGKNETTWPGQRTIAKESGLHKNGVKKCLSRLKELGAIKAVGKKKSSDILEIIWPVNGKSDSRHPAGEGTQSVPREGHNVSQTGTQSVPHEGDERSSARDTECTSEGHNVSQTGTQRVPDRATECHPSEPLNEPLKGTTQGTTEALRCAARGADNPAPVLGASLDPAAAGGTQTATPESSEAVGATQTANQERAFGEQKHSGAQSANGIKVSTEVAAADPGSGQEWTEVEISFIDAEFEDGEFVDSADAPFVSPWPPSIERPMDPAPAAVKPSSGPAPTEAPPRPEPAAKQPAAAEPANGAARKKPKSSKVSDKLTEADLRKICESYDNTLTYLLWGKSCVLDPAAEKIATQFNWRVNIIRPGEFTEESLDAKEWTIRQLAGFFWFRVSLWRQERGIAMSLPSWGRLCGEIKNLIRMRGGNWRAIQYLNCLTHLFDLHCVMAGNIGESMALNETIISNAVIRGKVESFMMLSNERQLQMFNEHLEQLEERKARYARGAKPETDTEVENETDED